MAGEEGGQEQLNIKVHVSVDASLERSDSALLPRRLGEDSLVNELAVGLGDKHLDGCESTRGMLRLVGVGDGRSWMRPLR
jgi:hypothetical protein